MSNNENDPENPSSKDENESALHMFKNFLVLDTYETDKYAGSSPTPRLGKGNEAPKYRDQKLNKKNEINRGKKEQGKAIEKINIGERRDPEKTKRDIEKDKFYKKTDDIVKTLVSGLVPPGMESEDSKIYSKTDVFVKKIECGLVPPGMETEVLFKPDSPNSLESLSATESISPINTISGDNREANSVDLQLQVKKGRKLTQEQELWKQLTPDSRPKFSGHNQPQFRMSRTPPHNMRFSFRHMSKSPIRRSPVRFARVRSPKRIQRSPGGRLRSRSPKRFWEVRSPNKFPRSRSPNRLPRRSPDRFQRHRWIRRSPIRQSRSRERSINRRAPRTENVSRRRSTERFLQELIKTSGIQDGTASPNVSQEFSNPDTPVMFMEFPPPMFNCGPPTMAFPPFDHPGEVDPNLMPPDGNIYYPNAADFNIPPPTFPPVPYPADFPPDAAPEAPMYFPPPIVPPPEPVGSKPASSKDNAAQRPFYEVKLQNIPLNLIPESKVKIFPINNTIKAEIISRCQDAVLKLDSLHFPNRLFGPPEEHAVFNVHKSAKASPLLRRLSPTFSFTTKPNDSSTILLPSIISTIGLDETLSAMALPALSFTPAGKTSKDAFCQTDDYRCNYCIIRKDTLKWHKSTMTPRSTVSVHCQVSNEDLRCSNVIFTPNQSEAPLQEKPVSLMHMTPAQILVAELTAKAKSLQRSTVEAAQRAKQDQMGQSGSRREVTGAAWLREEQHDGDSYGYKRGQNQSQAEKSSNRDPEQGYKEDGAGNMQGKGYGQGQRRTPGQGFSQGQAYQQGQGQGYQQGQSYQQGQGQGKGYDQDDNYGSERNQSQSKLTREYDDFLSRIQSEKPKTSGNRRNNPY